MDAIPPISSGLPPVVRATRPPVKRVERIAREHDRPEEDADKRKRERRGSAAELERQGPDGDERPHIDIRV
ncbi:MAG TPA: hypothetical protein VGL79_04500 [Solirubrobacteraceae bacterium]|jgi:hypothetical protein